MVKIVGQSNKIDDSFWSLHRNSLISSSLLLISCIAESKNVKIPGFDIGNLPIRMVSFFFFVAASYCLIAYFAFAAPKSKLEYDNNTGLLDRLDFDTIDLAKAIELSIASIKQESEALLQKIKQSLNDAHDAAHFAKIVDDATYINRKGMFLRDVEQRVRQSLRIMSDREGPLVSLTKVKSETVNESRQYVNEHIEIIERIIAEEFYNKYKADLASLSSENSVTITQLTDKISMISEKVVELKRVSKLIYFRIFSMKVSIFVRNIAISTLAPFTLYIVAFCHAFGKYVFVMIDYDLRSFVGMGS